MRDPAPDSAVRPCVLVPVYNNVATIAGVIAEIRRFLDQVMVVDDGSTDGTQEILKATESITLVRHDHNRGKGAALQSGFDRAADLGFTHVITMDGDGQHTAADLPAFLRTIHDRPEALVLGVRQLAAPGRRPMKSRLLRAHSNCWVWLETGVRTADSMSSL